MSEILNAVHEINISCVYYLRKKKLNFEKKIFIAIVNFVQHINIYFKV